MAARKKTRKVASEKSKAGRKKEIKRFEMEVWTRDAEYDRDVESNEVAFVVRTSGGTPLNPTDTGKLHRLLQHELRRLGHKLKRKGQDLDPAEPKTGPESAEVAPDVPEDEKRVSDDQPSPASDTLDPDDTDPDDSDAHTDLPTPQ